MSALRLALRAGLSRQTLFRNAVSKPVPVILQPTPSLASYQWRGYASKKVEETDAEFDARWEAYFNRDGIDAWELRKGLNDLYGYDLVPEPKIVIAMLKAARRLNDVSLAVRILEAVKDKAAGNQTIYNNIIKAVKPTLEELGLRTPEELGLA